MLYIRFSPNKNIFILNIQVHKGCWPQMSWDISRVDLFFCEYQAFVYI